jgi:MSHA biogenesis protein MshM
MLQGLNTFLLEQHALGRNAVLIVDEAQALGASGLEAIRLLSNLETERNKLLQIVLFGQSELDELLQQPNLRQVNQRIGFSFNTQPLTMDEAAEYVMHRVKTSRVDGIDFPIFSQSAIVALADAASLVPRVINILADKALLVAYGDGAIQVSEKHARGAIEDSPQIVRRRKANARLWKVAGGTAIAASAAAIISLVMLNAPVTEWAKTTYAKAYARFVSAPVAPSPARAAASHGAPAEGSITKTSADGEGSVGVAPN